MKLIELVNAIDLRDHYFVVHVNSKDEKDDFDSRKHSITWVSVMANREVLEVSIRMVGTTPYFYIIISCIER